MKGRNPTLSLNKVTVKFFLNLERLLMSGHNSGDIPTQEIKHLVEFLGTEIVHRFELLKKDVDLEIEKYETEKENS